LKFGYFIDLIKSGQTFRVCRVFVYIIEYQKRGLLYVYIIVFLDAGHAYSDPIQINNLIRAELSDKEFDLDGSLNAIVKQVMIQGSCDYYNYTALYMAKKDLNSLLRCIKYYPREFHDQMTINNNGYPIYRR